MTTTQQDPVFTRLPDYHRYEWPDQIFATLANFQDGRNRDAYAEVQIFQNRDEGRSSVPVTQKLNLISGDSQKKFAKLVAERLPVNDDWIERVNWMCFQSLKEWRQAGPPIVDLASVEVDYDTDPYLLSPYIVKDGVTLMYADSSAGKSLFVVACALSVATGIALLGVEPTDTTKALYLDWEDSPETHKERADALLTAHGVAELPDGRVFYRPMERSLQDSKTYITTQIHNLGIGLVIIDSLSLAAGDPSEVGNILETFNIANNFNVPTIIIHHVSKEAAKQTRAEDKREYGSVFSRAGARLSWIIEKEQEEDDDQSLIRLTNTKINRGSKWPKQAFRVGFTNENNGHLRAARYESITAYDYAEAAEMNRESEQPMSRDKEPTIRSCVLLVLKANPGQDCKKIAEGVDLIRGITTGEEVIRSEMKRGEKAGLYEITGLVGKSNLWSLTDRANR